MATEHEFKYVISPDILKKNSIEWMTEWCDERIDIKQGYLNGGDDMAARVRFAHTVKVRHGKPSNKKGQWFFTFKKHAKGRLIEIEQKISKRDGKDLFSTADQCVEKVRFVFRCRGYVWELDVLSCDGKVYFVQLEVECKEGAERPLLTDMPTWIDSYVLHEVPLTDKRFSNKKLADVAHAERLLKKISKKEKDNVKDD